MTVHRNARSDAQTNVTDVVSPDHAQHLRLLEALIFAGTQALDEKELADRLPNDADVQRLLADLAELYANRGVNLVKVAGGYAFRTASDLSEKLKIERPVTRKLSRAAIETLAIIAYHQPVTRAEIEQVRGVGLSKGTLDLLFEQNWIRPMGRRRAPGKPVTWGTTDFFLEHFGLPALDDLPGQEEMKAAGLLDPRAQPPIFRPEEPDLPLEAGGGRGRRALGRPTRAGPLGPNTALFDRLPGLPRGCHNHRHDADRKRFWEHFHMGSFSLWHWLIVLAVVLLLFGGRGKISQLMGDFGKGLRPSRRASAAAGRDAAGPAGPAGRHGQADLGPGHDLAAGQPGPPGHRRQGLTALAQRRRRPCHVRHRQS